MRSGPAGGGPVRVTARLLPGDMVLLEMGDGGPHWVISTDDARAVGWSLIDAANGHGLLGGITVRDCHAPVTQGGDPT